MMYDLREEILTVTFFVLGRKPLKEWILKQSTMAYMQYGLAS